LPADLQSLLRETTTERLAAPGDYIARAGEPCLHWYGLLQGFLQMYVVGADGSETTLYCLREGQWGGEGSLLKKELRRYDLRALTPAHIFLVPVATFETLRQSSIAFNHFLCDIMNERMGTFVGMLEASRLHGPDQRVAKGLLMLANHAANDAQEISIPQHELALICGLSRQRVNMAISEFRRAGLVRTDIHKGILVVDVPRVRAYLLNDAKLPMERPGSGSGN
jgi:CRP/FNR family transcriptional regulator, cyclic AMP receptor protein